MVFEGKEINVLSDQPLGFFRHLALRNPQGGFGHRDCKIVDLDAIELVDTHLDIFVAEA